MSRYNKHLTQKRLKEILSYNPKSGIFIYKISRTNTKKGDIAGTLKLDGYMQMQIDGTVYPAHRLAFLYMTGDMSKEIDHIDGEKSNNKFRNLRACSRSENQRHRTKLNKNNKSGVRGVIWDKNAKKWRAQMTMGKKAIYLGIFIDIKDAADARKAGEIKHNFYL